METQKCGERYGSQLSDRNDTTRRKRRMRSIIDHNIYKAETSSLSCIAVHSACVDFVRVITSQAYNYLTKYTLIDIINIYLIVIDIHIIISYAITFFTTVID